MSVAVQGFCGEAIYQKGVMTMLPVGAYDIYANFNPGLYRYAAEGRSGLIPPEDSEKTGGRLIDGRFVSGAEREKAEKKEQDGKLGRKDPSEECQTCKNRKYQDGSDEMVSFKSPKHVSPESAASAVRAHEQEHVSNAYKKAATDDGKVISASVSIHTAICPECGRTYVSGGTTHTQIKYFNEDNPYQKGLKTADQAKYAGMNVDYAV